MISNLLVFGKIPISLLGAFGALSFFSFSFVFWKRLRDDFEEERILSLTIFLALAFFIGSRFFYILTHFSSFGFSFSWFFWRSHPGFSFLGGILALIGTLYFWARKNEWDFWHLADQALISFSVSISLFCLGIFIWQTDTFSFFWFLFSLFFLNIALFLSRNYRKFIWYESGKPGFVSSFCLFLFSLAILLLEIFSQNKVYCVGENFGFGLLFLGGLFFLYKRSERNLKQDWQKIKANFQRNRHG